MEENVAFVSLRKADLTSILTYLETCTWGRHLDCSVLAACLQPDMEFVIGTTGMSVQNSIVSGKIFG